MGTPLALKAAWRPWMGWAGAVLIAGGAWLGWSRLQPDSLPAYIASGNGRLEATEVDIATCAYFLYVNEGCPAGRELDHWLEAEARLRGR